METFPWQNAFMREQMERITIKVCATKVLKEFSILFVLLFDALFKTSQLVLYLLHCFSFFNAVLYMKGKTFSQLEMQPFINIDAA